MLQFDGISMKQTKKNRFPRHGKKTTIWTCWVLLRSAYLCLYLCCTCYWIGGSSRYHALHHYYWARVAFQLRIILVKKLLDMSCMISISYIYLYTYEFAKHSRVNDQQKKTLHRPKLLKEESTRNFPGLGLKMKSRKLSRLWSPFLIYLRMMSCFSATYIYTFAIEWLNYACLTNYLLMDTSSFFSFFMFRCLPFDDLIIKSNLCCCCFQLTCSVGCLLRWRR